MNWNEYEETILDIELVEKAIYEFKNNPKAADGIKFKCFNKEEAEKLKRIAKELCSEMPVYVSWRVFGEEIRR